MKRVSVVRSVPSIKIASVGSEGDKMADYMLHSMAASLGKALLDEGLVTLRSVEMPDCSTVNYIMEVEVYDG